MFAVCLLCILQTLQPHTNGPSVHMLLRCSRMSHELNTDVPRTDTIRRYPRGGGIWTASPPLACLQLAASGKHTQECYTVMYLHVMSACQHVSMSACQQTIALGQALCYIRSEPPDLRACQRPRTSSLVIQYTNPNIMYTYSVPDVHITHKYNLIIIQI